MATRTEMQNEETQRQYRGQVAWFNNAKGFGFLTHQEGPDVFVHFSAIEGEGYKALKEGEPVVFDVEIGTSGKPQAARVKRTEANSRSTGEAERP